MPVWIPTGAWELCVSWYSIFDSWRTVSFEDEITYNFISYFYRCIEVSRVFSRVEVQQRSGLDTNDGFSFTIFNNNKQHAQAADPIGTLLHCNITGIIRRCYESYKNGQTRRETIMIWGHHICILRSLIFAPPSSSSSSYLRQISNFKSLDFTR